MLLGSIFKNLQDYWNGWFCTNLQDRSCEQQPESILASSMFNHAAICEQGKLVELLSLWSMWPEEMKWSCNCILWAFMHSTCSFLQSFPGVETWFHFFQIIDQCFFSSHAYASNLIVKYMCPVFHSHLLHPSITPLISLRFSFRSHCYSIRPWDIKH